MNIEEIYSEVDSLLESYDIIYRLNDIGNLTFEDIFQGIHNVFISRITAPFLLFGMITAIIIFSAFIKSVNSSAISVKNDTADIISVLTATAVITEPLLILYSEISETIIKCGEFINLFVPIFASICALSGNISALGTYNIIVLGISQFIVWISGNYLLPALSMITALAVTDSIYSKSFFGSFTKFISKSMNWILTVCTSIFVGFLTLKNIVGTATDTFATKTAKFVISGFVPVIGGAVSDAYTTLKGSIGVLKGTAGMAGIIASLLIFIPPLIEVIAFRFVIKICGMVAEMFSVQNVVKLMNSLENGLSIILSIIVCFSLLFIISTAVLMKTNIS
ncbi:MAG: stage III sporulation protein AE [Oscillospiraceae bacterium]|nr:stage III sporulation protein AE [Oscillospiraceae bacterium]